MEQIPQPLPKPIFKLGNYQLVRLKKGDAMPITSPKLGFFEFLSLIVSMMIFAFFVTHVLKNFFSVFDYLLNMDMAVFFGFLLPFALLFGLKASPFWWINAKNNNSTMLFDWVFAVAFVLILMVAYVVFLTTKNPSAQNAIGVLMVLCAGIYSHFYFYHTPELIFGTTTNKNPT